MNRIIVTALTLIVGIACVQSQSVMGCLLQETSESALESARANANEARERYDSIVRLRAKGSASRWDVVRSDYLRKVALLKFGIVDQPTRKSDYELKIAQVTVSFASQRVDTFRKLANNGGISKLDYRRIETDLEIAKLRLKAMENRERTAFYAFKIAVEQYELAQAEFESLNRLYRKGAVSKVEFESAKTKRREAKSKVDQRKKELGGRAKVVNLKT